MVLRIDPYGNSSNAVLSGHLNTTVYEVVRGMPGRRKWREGRLVFEATRSNIEYLKRHLPDAHWNIKKAEHMERLDQLEADARAAKMQTMPVEAGNFKYKTEPRDYQEKTFLLSRDRQAYGLFLEQGLGKTKVALDTAAHLWANGKIDALFVLAPNGVHRQWVTEQIPTHLPDWVKYDSCIWQPNHTKKWKATWEQTLASPHLKVFTMNVEAVARGKGQNFAQEFLANTNAMFVVDESHTIKSQTASRTKFILALRDMAPYRRIMTGTPISKGLEDLFTQLKFLGEDVHGFSSFYTYRNRYCETVQIPGAPRGALKIVGYQNQDELKERIDAYSMRLRADECLNLPERIQMTRDVPMTKEQVRAYKDIANDLYTEIGSSAVSVEVAVVKIVRLQQIICGHLMDDDGQLIEIPHRRADVAYDIMEQGPEKQVFWTRFRYDVKQLMEKLKPFNPVFYDGSQSGDQKAEAKRRFLEDPDCRVFIGNQAAAGTGLDGLQKVCHAMTYYSHTLKAVDRWQSIGRLYRMGQQGTVVVTDMVAANTYDEDALANLSRKEDVATDILDIKKALARQLDLLEEG